MDETEREKLRQEHLEASLSETFKTIEQLNKKIYDDSITISKLVNVVDTLINK